MCVFISTDVRSSNIYVFIYIVILLPAISLNFTLTKPGVGLFIRRTHSSLMQALEHASFHKFENSLIRVDKGSTWAATAMYCEGRNSGSFTLSLASQLSFLSHVPLPSSLLPLIYRTGFCLEGPLLSVSRA